MTFKGFPGKRARASGCPFWEPPQAVWPPGRFPAPGGNSTPSTHHGSGSSSAGSLLGSRGCQGLGCPSSGPGEVSWYPHPALAPAVSSAMVTSRTCCLEFCGFGVLERHLLLGRALCPPRVPRRSASSLLEDTPSAPVPSPLLPARPAPGRGLPGCRGQRGTGAWVTMLAPGGRGSPAPRLLA